jgi:hypothetical protein
MGIGPIGDTFKQKLNAKKDALDVKKEALYAKKDAVGLKPTAERLAAFDARKDNFQANVAEKKSFFEAKA